MISKTGTKLIENAVKASLQAELDNGRLDILIKALDIFDGYAKSRSYTDNEYVKLRELPCLASPVTVQELRIDCIASSSADNSADVGNISINVDSCFKRSKDGLTKAGKFR